MNNKHLSWYKEINNNFIIASREYFLQSPTCTRVNNLVHIAMWLNINSSHHHVINTHSSHCHVTNPLTKLLSRAKHDHTLVLFWVLFIAMWTRLLTLVNPLGVGHMTMWTAGVNHMMMWTIGVKSHGEVN